MRAIAKGITVPTSDGSGDEIISAMTTMEPKATLASLTPNFSKKLTE
jgi:hypothetical protein